MTQFTFWRPLVDVATRHDGRRYFLPAASASRRGEDGRIERQRHGDCCLDLEWPWWTPGEFYVGSARTAHA